MGNRERTRRLAIRQETGWRVDLFDEQGRITFPVDIHGKGTGIPTILPDLVYLGKRGLANQAKMEIKKQLGNILGDVLESNTTSDMNQQEQDPSKPKTQEKQPFEDLINKGIDAIFK